MKRSVPTQPLHASRPAWDQASTSVHCHPAPWPVPFRSFNPHQPRVRAGAFHRIRLHHGIVLLKDPALGADVRRSQQPLQIFCQIARPTPLHAFRLGARYRRAPRLHWAVIQRRIICQRGVGNIGHQFPCSSTRSLPPLVTRPTITPSSPHFSKTFSTSCSRPLSATSSMRSCDSLSMIS